MSKQRNGTALVPAEHLRAVAGPNRVGQATAVEQSRAVAEVQAAVLVAQQCPRDVDPAVAEMRRSCGEPELADRAFYRYPRGGKTVTGTSIHLARELARCWGNIDYGIAELRRDDDHAQSEMRAWAWDQETNARAATTFIVPHGRDKDNGQRVVLTAYRDIYENNANMGGRRVREMILSVLPVWFVKEAERLARETVERGDGTPLTRRIDAVVAAFAKLNVSVPRIEAKLGRARHLWTAFDLAELTVVGQSIKAGEVTVEDEFPVDPERVTLDELQGGSTPVSSEQDSSPGRNPSDSDPGGAAPGSDPSGPYDRPEGESGATPATPEPPASTDPEAVTVDQLLAALVAAGRVAPKAAQGSKIVALVAHAAELVGVKVDHPDELVADQAVAEELLAKLTPAAE